MQSSVVKINKMFKNTNSAKPPLPSKWDTRPVTPLDPDQSVYAASPTLRRNTETAHKYARAYHDGNTDGLLRLLAPVCQFGTFFGFVWGNTATSIALAEEQSMKIEFVGKMMTFSANPGSLPKDGGKFRGTPKSIQQAWFAPSDEGLHKGAGAPQFARVTEAIFERDGYAHRNHRSFPYNIYDKFFKCKVRETIVVEDGVVTFRVLQNLTQFFPMPYDFM